jgi:hypothetical protein
LKDPPRGLYAVHAGHLQIHQDYVGLQIGGARYSLLATSRLAYDLEVGHRSEQGDHTLPEKRMVFGDEDTQGLQLLSLLLVQR